MTQNRFYENIDSLQNNFENRDLETYLLALLKLVDQENNQNLTPELLLKLLQDAFTSEPAAFNSEWLNIKLPPDPSINSDKNDIEYSIAVLHFQISELHKMRGKQLNDEMRYFGIDSETGCRWYNFDPMTNLECGARSILDSGEDGEIDFNVNWRTLGELLEEGRRYE